MEEFVHTYMRSTIHLKGTRTEIPGDPNCFKLPKIPVKFSWYVMHSHFYGKPFCFDDKNKKICLAIPIKEGTACNLNHGNFTMGIEYFYLMKLGAYVLNLETGKWDLLSEAVGLPKDMRKEFLAWKGKKHKLDALL